ncbi:hypothetical protein BC938DRAFT_483118, partial [Jimgerdemannia flammicorona]
MIFQLECQGFITLRVPSFATVLKARFPILRRLLGRFTGWHPRRALHLQIVVKFRGVFVASFSFFYRFLIVFVFLVFILFIIRLTFLLGRFDVFLILVQPAQASFTSTFRRS